MNDRRERVVGLLCAAILLAGGLAGCSSESPKTQQVEPPELPIILSTRTIRTDSYSTADIPEAYRASENNGVQVAYYLVRMSDRIRDSWLQRLADMDLHIAGYIPYNTLILGMTPAVREAVETLSFVKWVGVYQPLFKLAPEVQTLDVATGRPLLDVSIFSPAAVPEVTNALTDLGIQVLASSADTWRGKLRVQMDAAFLPKLAALPQVEWIEPAATGITAASPAQAAGAGATFPLSLYELFLGAYNAGLRTYEMNAVPWASGTARSYMAAASEADRFAWDHKDWLLALSSGDQGIDANQDGASDAGTIEPAGAAKNAVIVGSADASGGSAMVSVSSFSGRGPAGDGRIRPDIVAPGDPTAQVARSSEAARQFLAGQPGIALPSAALLKAMLVNGAGDIEDGSAAPNSSEGWGGLNLRARLTGDRLLKVQDNVEGIRTGEIRTYKVEVSGEGELCVSLAWIDYPSIPEAGLNLVNDLDLRVIGPGDTYYYPNGRSSRDPSNNLEKVVVPLAGGAGEYTIEITASNVPFGPQPFALIAARL